jgi:DNA polymerase III gamma/tau subunit
VEFDAGKSMDYMEVDAATNSGKADMKRIVESLAYTNFSGRRTLYVFDEAHQLTKDALDAILKPMEDPIPGSDEKQLVCIFCTTEPERMRSTILSRCAPAFIIRKPDVPAIVKRLEFVCGKEQIPFEPDALTALVEVTKSHMRDALKSLDGISLMHGGANMANVSQYLHIHTQAQYVEILLNLGTDFKLVVESVDQLLQTTSPSVAYDKMLEIVMMAHKVYLGMSQIPSYMDKEKLHKVATAHADFLLQIAERLAKHPGKPTQPMFLCDLGFLHHLKTGGLHATLNLAIQPTASHIPPAQNIPLAKIPQNTQRSEIPSVNLGQADGVYVPAQATQHYMSSLDVVTQTPLIEGDQLALPQFFELVAHRIRELGTKNARNRNVDRS